VLCKLLEKTQHETTYRCSVSFGRLSSGIWDTEVMRGELVWQTTFLPGPADGSLEATVTRSRCRFKIVQRQPEGQLYTPSETTSTTRSNKHKMMPDCFILIILTQTAICATVCYVLWHVHCTCLSSFNTKTELVWPNPVRVLSSKAHFLKKKTHAQVHRWPKARTV